MSELPQRAVGVLTGWLCALLRPAQAHTLVGTAPPTPCAARRMNSPRFWGRPPKTSRKLGGTSTMREAPPRRSGRSGTTPRAAPVGWVFLDRHHHEEVTIRWRRGEPVTYVLHGQRIGDDATTTGILDTIPVAPTGWPDLAEIRLLGQRWLRQR